MNNLTPFNALEAAKVFDEYFDSKSHRLGRQSQVQHKFYLSLVDNKLKLTIDKTQQASNEAIGLYINNLIDTLHSVPVSEMNSEIILAESKLTIIFNKFYSKESHHIFEELVNNMEAQTKPISENNPFYSTDLLVFSNDYTGTLPLNGIKETDFEEISTKINELKNKKICGSLSVKGGSTIDFNILERKINLVIEDIVLLCTRKTGREIVNLLIDQKLQEISIDPVTQLDPAVLLPTNGGNEITVRYNPDHKLLLGSYGNNQREVTNFIGLGHEFIHLVHLLNEKDASIERLSTKHPKMMNMEEYVTILGWKEEPNFPSVEVQNDDIKLESFFVNWDEIHTDDNIMSVWSEQSENGLRSIFSYLPRSNLYTDVEFVSLQYAKNIFFGKSKSENFQFAEEFAKLKVIAETEMEEEKFIRSLFLNALYIKNYKILLELVLIGVNLENEDMESLQIILYEDSILDPNNPYVAQFSNLDIMPKYPTVDFMKKVFFSIEKKETDFEFLKNNVTKPFSKEDWYDFCQEKILDASLKGVLFILKNKQKEEIFPDKLHQKIMKSTEKHLQFFFRNIGECEDIKNLIEIVKNLNDREQWDNSLAQVLGSIKSIPNFDCSSLAVFFNELDKDATSSRSVSEELKKLARRLIETFVQNESKGKSINLTNQYDFFKIIPVNSISLYSIFTVIRSKDLEFFKKYISFFHLINVDINAPINTPSFKDTQFFSVLLIDKLNMMEKEGVLDNANGLEWLKAFIGAGYSLFIPTHEKAVDLILEGPYLYQAIEHGLVDRESLLSNLLPEQASVIRSKLNI